MTHQELVKMASRFLSNTKRCSVVIAEIVTAAGEIPDVIGWRCGVSIVVECKVSRGDFMRDADKGHHRTGDAMGMQRYFLVPKGMVAENEVPEDAGLIEAYVPDELTGTSLGGKPYLRVKKEAPPRVLDQKSYVNELRVLTSAVRRLKTREFITILEAEEQV